MRLRASGCSKLTTDQQLEFWRDGLSECRSSIEVKLDGVNRRSTRAYGTGILKIKSNKKDRNETLRFKDPVKYAESWPVRYALFMGCVLMTGIKGFYPVFTDGLETPKISCPALRLDGASLGCEIALCS